MKKETALSVLQEIRDLLKNQSVPIDTVEQINTDWIEIDFPNLTAKEIVENCQNKTSSGTPLLYSTWMLNEPFYTNERCRTGKRLVSKKLVLKGVTREVCEAEAKKQSYDLLNFSEILYFLWWYEKEHGKRLLDYGEETGYQYAWTTSNSSDGNLVFGGYFDSFGMGVFGRWPGGAVGDLGVWFSRRS